jgi:Zn-ribbon-containing, possibly RNA-binding protein and truncated derivatives
MRKKTHKLRMQSIGEILFATLKRRGMAAKLEENAVLKHWPEAVGRQIVLQTQPDCLKNGTLFVKTTASVWVQQLHFMKEDIRRKLNDLAGKETVKDIRFSIGYEISKAKAAREAESATSRKMLLKERDRKMIEESTRYLTDRELAAILKRVMKIEISRRRLRQQQGR